jgi:hypothetical protein
MARHQREAIVFFSPQGFLTFIGFNAKFRGAQPIFTQL